MKRTTHGLVRLRERQLANGDISLYLDTYRNGARQCETLKIYLDGTSADIERRRHAETIRARRELELLGRSSGITTVHIRTQSVVTFAEDHARQKKYPYWQRLAALLKEYDATATMEGVTLLWCRRFGDHLKRSALGANTAAAMYGYFRQMLREAARSKMIDRALLDELKPLPKQDVEHVWLTIEELRRLAVVKTRATDTLRAYLISCYTGLRDSDIRRLTWGKITPYGVTLRQKKTSNIQHLPLSKQARAIIGERPDGAANTDPVVTLPNRAAISRGLKTMAKRAGIDKRLHFHSGRHTFAVLYMSNGGDLYVLSKILGHSDIQSTQIYADIVEQRLHEGVELIPGL